MTEQVKNIDFLSDRIPAKESRLADIAMAQSWGLNEEGQIEVARILAELRKEFATDTETAE